jgi:hypothetical protein
MFHVFLFNSLSGLRFPFKWCDKHSLRVHWKNIRKIRDVKGFSAGAETFEDLKNSVHEINQRINNLNGEMNANTILLTELVRYTVKNQVDRKDFDRELGRRVDVLDGITASKPALDALQVIRQRLGF